MTDNQSFYDIINVPPSATPRQIKKAYRRIMKESHHDNVGTEYDKQKIIRLHKALEVLNDPDKREQYDIEKGFSNRSKTESVAVSGRRYSRKTDQAICYLNLQLNPEERRKQ